MKNDTYWREPCKRELPPEPKAKIKQRKPFNSWLSLFILVCLLFVSQRLMFGEQQSVQSVQSEQQTEQPMQQTVQQVSEPTAANPWAQIPAASLPYGDAEAY